MQGYARAIFLKLSPPSGEESPNLCNAVFASSESQSCADTRHFFPSAILKNRLFSSHTMLRMKPYFLPPFLAPTLPPCFILGSTLSFPICNLWKTVLVVIVLRCKLQPRCAFVFHILVLVFVCRFYFLFVVPLFLTKRIISW